MGDGVNSVGIPPKGYKLGTTWIGEQFDQRAEVDRSCIQVDEFDTQFIIL